MSHKRREQKRQRLHGEGDIRWAAVLRAIVLGGAAALLVIAAIVPSESAIPEGACAPIATAWCLLLLLWSMSVLFDDRPLIRVGWTEAAASALVGWHSLAAVVSLSHTNGRFALNAHWLVLSYAIGAFLIRQCLRTASQARCLLAVMLWLAALLASLGIYQYAYGMPRLRAEFEKDPERVLTENNLPIEADSPQREHFANRVRSLEPLATFALTNSLAGVLAPWLIIALALLLGMQEWAKNVRPFTAILGCALLMAACLALTKSRSAYLATACGVGLVLLYGRPRGWQLDWRIPVVLAGVALVIGLAAVFFGGLDLEVLSEAPKSVLYRLEYWQATARVIVDNPFFGCGPGNFQEVYAQYQLPQASETVADPHNFLLELWATAGTPALVFLLAVLAGFVLDLAALTTNKLLPTLEEQPVARASGIFSAGAGIGLVVGPLVSGVMDTLSSDLPIPILWFIGPVLGVALWWLLRDWLESGRVSLAALVVPQVVLLVNLLAAGSLYFPAVISTLVVLVPLALAWPHLTISPFSTALPKATTKSSIWAGWQPSKSWAAAIFAGCALMALACLYTEYYPLQYGRTALADAIRNLGEGRIAEGEGKLVESAKSDSLSPEPWRVMAQVRLGRWQATQSSNDWRTFLEAVNTLRTLDPRHHLTYYTRGNLFLAAWRKSQQQEDLNEALAAYREASRLFPNRAQYHAQLAWVLHLANQPEAALAEAEKAWNLDQQMPHHEQKLNRQHVFDPNISRDKPRDFLDETAEQTVQRLRKMTADD